MKIQHIIKAAHGSSGVSELNTRGAGVLKSAKKKLSTFAGRHKTKRFLCAFLAVLPVFCFGDYTDIDSDSSCRMYAFKSSTSGTFPTSQALLLKPSTIGNLFYSSLTSTFGICFSSSGELVHPKQSSISSIPTNKTYTVDYPVVSTSNNIFYCLEYACPQLYSLFSLAAHVYADGNHLSSLKVVYTGSNTFVNFIPIDFISELMTSTNTLYRSSVIHCLSSLPDINNSLSSIDRNLMLLSNRSSADFDISTLSNRLIAAQNLGLSNEMSVDVDTALDNLNFSTWDTSQPEFAGVYESLARSYDRALNTIETLSGLSAIPVDPSGRSKLNDLLADFGNSLMSRGSAHFTTPLTNEMQRMSTNWVQDTKAALSNWVDETKAALSNNTQKIKDDLKAWRDQLSGPNGSQAAIVSKLDGAINNQGAVKVEVQNSNNELHVNVNGPIELKATQFNDINNKLQANFDQFHDWVYDIPESWVRYYNLFRDNSSAVLTNQFGQASLLSSLTNLVSDFSDDFSDFSLGFASNTTFAVSNALLGLSLFPTNELWDYYFDRFKKANEFNDDSGLPFSLDLFRQQVFGSGFDESKFRQLDWFSRVELLLYQISYAETNDVPEAADIETDLEDVAETVSAHAEDFVATSIKVVSVFNLLKRFADSVKLAFTPQNGQLDPMTSGIVLLQGGSWLVNEPLVLNVPVPVQNALRLVFQCIWYLGAFVVGWRVFSAAWDHVVSVVRWIWSVFDI